MFLSRKTPENAELAIAGPYWTRPKIVTRRRPSFACVQAGAGDLEHLVFRGFAATKTPSIRLQAGYRLNLGLERDFPNLDLNFV